MFKYVAIDILAILVTLYSGMQNCVTKT